MPSRSFRQENTAFTPGAFIALRPAQASSIKPIMLQMQTILLWCLNRVEYLDRRAWVVAFLDYFKHTGQRPRPDTAQGDSWPLRI